MQHESKSDKEGHSISPANRAASQATNSGARALSRPPAREPSEGAAQLVDSQAGQSDSRTALPDNRTALPDNRTGLPDNLKSGVENLSGLSLDDVKVHYNSAKPAELNAHAFAMGTDIHVAPGQERHLPHEAWHVVQQKEDRVQPTTQMNGVNVNDDARLEREATAMGDKAVGG
ncbi:MAG TPA: DUF4157 domain-containing protein [Puia sp.]|jgi:hypothetical protein|nr:DUF4157 domain-containing protein [Puia sp.]